MTPRTATAAMSVIVLLLAAFWLGYSPPPKSVIPADRQFLTMLDFAAIGNQRATDYAKSVMVEQSPPRSLFWAHNPLRKAVGRIQVHYGKSQIGNGSGVLVHDGRFMLTAGHVVAAVTVHPDAEIKVFFRNEVGTQGLSNLTVNAKVLKSVYDASEPQHDWCVLEMLGPIGEMPSLPLATPQPGEEVYVYGYPTNMGVNKDGGASYWSENEHLDSMLMVCRIPNDMNWSVEPVAGARSLGGMSGGPILNRAGEVVALITGWNRHLTWGEATHTTSVSYLDEARAFLDKQ